MVHARLPRSFCLIAASMMLLVPTAAQCGTAMPAPTAKVATVVRATDRTAVQVRNRTQQETSPDTGPEITLWLIAVLLLLSAGLAARRQIMQKLLQRREVPA